TNDYNLNKIARIEGVEVLNINDLVNAIKPVLLPGEELELDIVKEGKEHGQGIGSLPDGTMVVVAQGAALVGKKMRVQVTSLLQTSAGRIIFTEVMA
ncbi:MAG: TRAM domain-containing protein, partial [Brevinema sp.]